LGNHAAAACGQNSSSEDADGLHVEWLTTKLTGRRAAKLADGPGERKVRAQYHLSDLMVS